MMNQNNYSKGSQDSIRFVQKTVVKDWQMFKDTLNTDATLSVDEKKEILAVVNGPIVDFLEKEKELQKLKSYKYLSTKLYPRLRNARTEVFSVKVKKTDSQMAILAKAIIEGRASQDTLTSEELAYAATLTPDLKEKEAIYLACTKKSGNWQSYNNLGAIYLEMARKQYDQTKMLELADKALTQLLLSVKQKETGHAYANLASAYMMKSDKAKCTESATKAAALSQDEDIRKGVNSLRAVWEIKAGKYDNAVASLQNGKSDDSMVKFDLALALLLKKDYEKAKVAFDDATTANDKNAIAWYGAAITAARLKDGERLGNRLQKAISLDGNLRSKALEDLEFMNYWNTDAFKTAVK
jgi:tetratricopeptide (TPR) repeat protein